MSYLSALNYKYKDNDSGNTLFVFDTNYFLYAYQSYYNSDAYLSALENKKEDVYVPFITYIEFLFNLNSVINSLKEDIRNLETYMDSVSEEVKIFDKLVVKSKLKSESFNMKPTSYSKLNDLLKKDIEKNINTYVNDTIEEVEEKYNEIEEIVKSNLKRFKDSNKNLPTEEEYEEKIRLITDRIDKLLAYKDVVGQEYTQEKLDEYLLDMSSRYDKNIPPGFCDKSKEGVKIFGDVAIPNMAGDLVVWKDVLEKLEQSDQKKYSNVVIVTDDGVSNQKSDWRVKVGKDKIVHDQLKIECYQKTGKFLDLMRVEEFISKFSMKDDTTNNNVRTEIEKFQYQASSYISSESIYFTLFNELYVSSNQTEMMKDIFEEIINRSDLKYDDLKGLVCIGTNDDVLNSVFNSFIELALRDGTKVLLGTRLNKTDKLRYLNKLFEIAGVDARSLVFNDIELQRIWQGFSRSKDSLKFSNEIVVYLESPERLLGVSTIGDVKFYSFGIEVNNNVTDRIKRELINTEFYDESNESKEFEFEKKMWYLGYNIKNQAISFEGL